MTDIATKPANAPVQNALIGTWRRFGAAGPVYEIIGQAATANDTAMMRIRVLESAEETDYRLADILADPRET
jgi:hypothetical protein